ncbi:hypothetical protein C2845_PM05G22100 [Panicum miliaceum]|uniref:F-box domain-containing protein n=1 Tax=Panicum miliaceum TaxID=4540 RepID=A0A3L6T1W8_PANMI|nr:hypothetical protein C2845_PM05G22100 [Panicum miliaceum]
MRPPGKKAKQSTAPAAAGIDALPDGVLEHILGFLPSPEAVRTCVLARRWRHRWRHATGVRVSCLAAPRDVRAQVLYFRRGRRRRRRELHEPLAPARRGVQGCPSLEHLVIESCELWDADRVSSESLKHLRMTSCIFSKDSSTVIHAPSLVSLRLDGHLYRAPVLEIMPSLQDAFVRVVHENLDSGYSDDYSGDCDDEDCYSCYGAVDGIYKCVLLEGLSEAENLALISESKAGPKHKMEMIGRYNPTDKTAVILEHLKEIEVKCEVVDEKVHKVLKFLCTFNICKHTGDPLDVICISEIYPLLWEWKVAAVNKLKVEVLDLELMIVGIIDLLTSPQH